MFNKALSSLNLRLSGYPAHTLWLLSDKIFKIFLGLVVTVWVARYLGPEQFGVFNYVLAFVSLFAPLSKLGLDGIASRELATVDTHVRRNELVNTVILMKFIGALFLLVLAFSYMYFVKESIVSAYLAVLFASVFLVRSFEVTEFFFRITVKGRLIAIANSCAVLFASSLKVVFIIASYPMVFFAFANLLEAVVSMVVLTCAYLRYAQGGINLNLVSVETGIRLLKESWPLIISGFSALVYLYVDQLMIESMLGSYELGQYSAASRLSSAVYFVPLTICWALQSAILREKQKGRAQYLALVEHISAFLVVIAFVITIPIVMLSDWVVGVLYGSEYSEAAQVLFIHMWAGLFVFVGAARGVWITNESFFKFLMFSNIVGALLNITLNFLFLPIYGIDGAAWATVISYGFTYVMSGFFYKPIWPMLAIQIRSLLLLTFLISFFAERKRVTR